jgi:hypothetical protein
MVIAPLDQTMKALLVALIAGSPVVWGLTGKSVMRFALGGVISIVLTWGLLRFPWIRDGSPAQMPMPWDPLWVQMLRAVSGTLSLSLSMALGVIGGMGIRVTSFEEENVPRYLYAIDWGHPACWVLFVAGILGVAVNVIAWLLGISAY